jgi:organic hydroperoxide reductase OsmC/OhrA
MQIEARVRNEGELHAVELCTNDVRRSLAVPPRATTPGSSVNGGEMLCLALATCYCNDIYREAAGRKIEVLGVEVTASAEFGGVGEPARSLRYRAKVTAKAPESAILALMTHTDRVAEIQNTLRRGIPVEFDPPVAKSAG